MWTEAVPLTKQPAGWPQIGVHAHPYVDPTTGVHNYWLGRDMWIEPGTNGAHWYIRLVDQTLHEVDEYLAGGSSNCQADSLRP